VSRDWPFWRRHETNCKSDIDGDGRTHDPVALSRRLLGLMGLSRYQCDDLVDEDWLCDMEERRAQPGGNSQQEGPCETPNKHSEDGSFGLGLSCTQM